MATAPFNIDPTTPGDSDIVSQFPGNERTNRDNIKSYIGVDHNIANGFHTKVTLPFSATPATPPASNLVVFASTTGRLKLVGPDGAVVFVGVPPGNLEYTASASVPVGWLLADGTAYSRSVYADLFAAIGTTYGAGDGVTTFNVPDLRGVFIAGVDGGRGKLTSTGLGTAAILAAQGGTQTTTLIASDVPAGVPSVTGAAIPLSVKTSDSLIPFNANVISANIVGGATFLPAISVSGLGQQTSTGSIASISVTSTNASQTAFKNIPPTLVLNGIIKF